MDSEDTSFPFIDTKEKCIAAHLIQLRRVCFILAKDKTAQVQLDFDTYWSEDGLMAIYRE